MSRGHVRKRGSRWVVVLELKRDAATNKRQQKWLSGYATRKEAERALSESLAKLDRGSFLVETKQTVSDFIEHEFLPALKPTVRPATYHSYERNLRLHVMPAVGHRPLGAVDPATLTVLYGALLSGGRKDQSTGTPLSPRTVAYIATIVGRVFRQARDWDLIARNPAERARPPKVATHSRSTETATWSAAEVAAFLATSRAEADPLYAAWLTLVTTGLRRGELLGLRWRDLDLDGARASIQQTMIVVVMDGRHEVRVGSPKTEKSRREVSLDVMTVAALRAHRVAQAEARLWAGGAYQDQGLVFAQPDGRPLHPERFSRAFTQRVRRHGMRRIRLHDLRHTHATLALRAGVHPKVVQERMGHANVGITLGIYSHVTPALDAAAAETIASEIFRSPIR